MPLDLEAILQEVKKCREFGKICEADSDSVSTGAMKDYHDWKDRLFNKLADHPVI